MPSKLIELDCTYINNNNVTLPHFHNSACLPIGVLDHHHIINPIVINKRTPGLIAQCWEIMQSRSSLSAQSETHLCLGQVHIQGPLHLSFVAWCSITRAMFTLTELTCTFYKIVLAVLSVISSKNYFFLISSNRYTKLSYNICMTFSVHLFYNSECILIAPTSTRVLITMVCAL